MYISLGYSCQTRFMIDALTPDTKRLPFDFNIASRPALIRALETDGASLSHARHTTSTYIMPKEQREGVEVSGLYFWHDYPLGEDKLSLSPDWHQKISQVNEKYAALWLRFSDLIRSDVEKTLVMSNSQHNLPQFAADPADFDRRFGLGLDAFRELTTALDAFGARNYRLKFLSRSVRELAETTDVADNDRFEHRFVGALSLRPDPDIVSALFSVVDDGDISALHGAYDDAEKRVEPISDKAALIFRQSQGGPDLWGSIAVTQGGFIAAFEGRDQIFTAVKHGGNLHFSNGARWTGTPA